MEIHRGQVVTPTGVITDGLVAGNGGIISYVGPCDQAPRTIQSACGEPTRHYLLPGLVDLHNHGGGGVSFPEATSVDEIAAGVQAHRSLGTHHIVASLVTAPLPRLREQITLLRQAADEGLIAGIHLEGPFLSAARCGAQDPAHIRPGDPEVIEELIDLGQGWVKTVTVAPETAHCHDVVAKIIEGGAIPSYGHTDADGQIMTDAIDAGIAGLGQAGRPTITHVFNAMPPLHHRQPGPIPAVLAAASKGQVVVEVIGDGVHISPQLLAPLFTLIGADNIALISDAMAAAGMDDGAYLLGGLDVIVDEGVARLSQGGAIAGGTKRLLEIVKTVVESGVGVVEAVKAAATVPARILGIDRMWGSLVEGKHMAVVKVDEGFNLV